MKAISDSKLKAFSIGRMNVTKNVLNKKEKEEIKKKEEDKKTQEVYKEFVASFEGSKSNMKTFVRGDVINPDKSMDTTKGKLYKPKSRLHEPDTHKPNVVSSPITPKSAVKPDRPTLKKKEYKKKSNLELFKEELMVMQKEREQRHTVKKTMQRGPAPDNFNKPRQSRFQPLDDKIVANIADPSVLDDLVASSHENGDPMTTNLFLGNVNPKLDEQQLCELFGKYGPLASVKVMWPRTEDERARERNCAFVAFMTRKDADRALRHLQGRDICDYEMKLGWGKSVPIPPHPVYVPPALLDRTLPPAPSGLPFNAQPLDPMKKPPAPGVPPEFADQQDFENTLKNSVVRVVVPTERNLLALIHRMIEFVVREGPMFEAMIMNREINNPMFRFLFNNKSPAHIYYRWRTYSVLHGESPTNYRTAKFRIFRGGSLWQPPPLNPYSTGLEETDSEDEFPMHKSAKASEQDVTSADTDKVKGELKEDERDKLEDILRSLLPRQKLIGDAMVFCLQHAECAEEIVECLAESLSILETPLTKKIARLYLISDILHNSSAKVANASFFRKQLESKLEQVMTDLHLCHVAISSRLRAEQFKQKILSCFRAWDDWAIYPDKLLIHLQNTFLGLVGGTNQKQVEPKQLVTKDEGPPLISDEADDDDVDGVPMDSVDVDGMPLDGEPLDGVPLENKKVAEEPQARFVQSKWEMVDPVEVEAQAMTTSKWDQLENQNYDGEPLEESHSQSENLAQEFKYDESKRAKLREIEVKVMKFQDELESGQRERKSGVSISKQVSQYREKLLDKVSEREEKMRHRDSDRKKDKRRGQSSSDDSDDSEHSKKKRRKKNKESSDTPSHHGLGLVSYDSDGSSDSLRKYSLSAKKKKYSGRTRSRSREKYSRKVSTPDRRRSKSPHRSKRSRSRSRERKKKRKSKH
ncbi:U2 snRNP-associated SURP motif-containing protein-like [Ciona intestinalis]